MDQDLFYSGTDLYPRLRAVALRLYVSASMGLDRVPGERGRALREALSTENLILLCLILAAWALSQFTPLGPAVDTFLAWVGYATLAEQLFEALDGARQWALAAYYAADKAALDRAANMAAAALGQVEARAITDLVSYGAFRAASRILRFFKAGDFTAAKQRVEEATPKPESKPEAKPESKPEAKPESKPEDWGKRLAEAARDAGRGAGAMRVGQEVGAALDGVTAIGMLLLLLLVVGGGVALSRRGRR